MILPDGTLSLTNNTSIEHQSFSAIESVHPPIMEIIPSKEAPKEEFSPIDYLEPLSAMFSGKYPYMLEMLEILLQQLPVASKKMEQAIALENWQEVFFQSHRIKSTLRIAGLQELVDICIEIESRTRIIATDELYLVSRFFEQFQTLTAIETPRLKDCVDYLKDQLQKNQKLSVNAPPVAKKDSTPIEEVTFLLP